MTTNSLEGKVALVTGGAKRVGKAVALHFAQHGADVAITYLKSKQSADGVVQHIGNMGRRAVAIRADLAEPDATAQIHDALTATYDRLDILVNNASIFERTELDSLKPKDFDRHMSINARAPLMLIQQFAGMLAAHYDHHTHQNTGRIINLIDTHVLGQPLRHHAAYNASKAALMEITMSCAVDLAPAVTVNAIAPGVVAWAQSYTPDERDQYMKRVPLAREGTPQDVANATAYLAGDGGYCTGQVIRLDGGRHLT